MVEKTEGVGVRSERTEWALKFAGTGRFSSERVEFYADEPDDVLQMIENDMGRRNVMVYRNGLPICTVLARAD